MSNIGSMISDIVPPISQVGAPRSVSITAHTDSNTPIMANHPNAHVRIARTPGSGEQRPHHAPLLGDTSRVRRQAGDARDEARR